MIIGVTGYAKHGKDSTGKILMEEFGFKRYAFADILKSMAMVLNPIIPDMTYTRRLYQLVQDQGWDEAKKVPEVRRFLQVLGTEAVRDHIGEDAWVTALENQITEDGLLNSGKVVITDVRFPNEADWVHSIGGVLWRITRYANPDYFDHTPFDNGIGTDHPSEKYISSLPANREIKAHSLDDLRREVRKAMTEVRVG